MFKFLLIAFLAVSCSTSPAKPIKDSIVLQKNNVFVLNGAFKPEIITPLMQDIIDKTSKNPTRQYYLFINSPGGYTTLGLDLINLINGSTRNLHTICSFCASMGFQTVQGVKGKRFITPSGTLMAHKARGGFKGEFPGQIDSKYSFWLKRLNRLDSITVSRTKGKHTLKSFQALYENEYWCEAQDCVNQGLADKVVYPTCGASLSGTVVEDKSISFFGQTIKVKVKSSKCPLITSPLGISAEIAGRWIGIESVTNIQLKHAIVLEVDPVRATYGKFR